MRGSGFVRPLLLVVPVSVFACTGDDDEANERFEPRATIESVREDPLAASGLDSCPVYQEETCQGGVLKRCAIYDVGASSFVSQPDPLLEKVYLYDRWYDLHSSPQGLTAERVFDGAMPGDTPEAEWSSLNRFSHWAGAGDAAIWTGAALVSDTFRYAVNGTEADYQRMENRVRVLLRNFDVTGVPGYLARYHFLAVPQGTPNDDKQIFRYNEPGDSDIDMPSVDVEGIPEIYTSTIGTPRWNGDPSIDQYTGPMMSFPLVYNLLRDDTLKTRMTHHLTCYLKRLERIEVINMRARPDLLEELKQLFGGDALKLDPNDPDLTQLDHLIMYVHPGINRENADDFVGTCPDQVQLEPARVLDARKDSFELDLLNLAADINRDNRTLPTQIDHFYVVNLRGGDASHLIHLAAIAYYFTGEEQYRSFLFDELIGNIKADQVAKTMMAFRLPDFCFKYYGDHITYGTHWQLITMLPPGPLRDTMIQVMREEAWEKALYNHHSSKFNVLYSSVVPDAEPSILQTALDQLRDFGGNGGTKIAPRRTHNRSRQEIIDAMPSGMDVRCPTEEERMRCENRQTFFGIDLEGKTISYECDGRPGECTMADGMCVEGIASDGLPSSLRIYADFMWQRSPFTLGGNYGADGQKQSPGRDLTEPYWTARYYGMINEGTDHVLAWEDAGSCQ